MSTATILLVEREAKTRRMLGVALEQAGYDVVVARDGTEALGKLEAEAPHLVLAATHLPKLDGYGLVRQMKDNDAWAAIPVMFMVTGESIEDKIRGLELGVEDYLSKPVFVKELLARVEVLLAKRVRQHLSESVTQTRVQGSLSDLPTIDLLESLEHGQQSGIVRIRSGGREGEVIFQDGEIVDAHLRRLRGEEVVYRLLCLTEGTFEVEIKNVDVEPVIEVGTRALIEAGMRHAAEFQRLLKQLPPKDVPVEVDREALAARVGEIPADLDRILELLDGRRTVLDVIDESPFDDLSTLETIAQLDREGLLHEVPEAHPSIAPDIPRPPRTPAPPASDVAPPPEDADDLDESGVDSDALAPPPVPAPPPVAEPHPPPAAEDDAEEDFDDRAPTLRPPDAEGRKKRRAEPPVALSGVPEDARPTIQIPPEDRQAIDRAGQGRAAGPGSHKGEEASGADSAAAQQGPATAPGHRGPAKAKAERGAEEPGGDQPSSASAAAAKSEPSPAAGDAPAARQRPKSVPPDTSAVDAAFDEIPPPAGIPAAAESPAASDSRPAVMPPVLAAAAADGAPAPSGDDAHSEALDSAAPSDSGPSDGAAPSDARPSDSRPSDPRPEVPSSDAPKGEGRKRKKSRKRRRKAGEPESGPSSGPPALSTSGVADQFFASLPPGHEPEEEPLPMSEREPQFLTEEQVARKKKAKRVVGIVVGVLAALLLFVVLRGGISGPKAPTPISSASSAPPPASAATTASGTAAAPSASAALAAEGGAGGTREQDAGAGEGGAAGATGAGGSGAAPGEDGAGGGELPTVEDPLGEAKKLLNAGRYRDTIPMAKAAIDKDPENGDGYFFLGMAYQSIGEIEKSKDAFDACVANAKTGANLNWCRTYARRK